MKLRRQIKGFNYCVTNDGEIISLPKARLTPKGTPCLTKERKLKPGRIGENGYEIVYLRKNGKSIRFYVHRLVAEAFIENPNSLEFVNHINGVKFDNRADNLEWCSRAQNGLHACRVLEVGKSRKVAQYDRNGNYIKTWANSYQASEQLGINRGNINSCVNKHRKTAGGFRWEAICV